MRTSAATVIVAAAMSLLSCSRTPDPVPLPRAYPRVEAYSDSTVTLSAAGVSFGVDAEARASSPRDGWTDIVYPRYAAAIHVSVVKPDSPEAMREAIDNRLERTDLNLAGRRADTEQFVNSAGFHCRLTVTSDPAPVPLQFIAVSPSGRLVSGAVAMTGPVEPADSVAPAIRELTSDIRTLLDTLSE